MEAPQYMGRKSAGEYLQLLYGFCSENQLAKLACLGGGPRFHKVGSKVVYGKDELDRWATEQLGTPRRSTSNADSSA